METENDICLVSSPTEQSRSLYRLFNIQLVSHKAVGNSGSRYDYQTFKVINFKRTFQEIIEDKIKTEPN